MKKNFVCFLVCILNLPVLSQYRQDKPLISDVSYQIEGNTAVIQYAIRSARPSDVFQVWLGYNAPTDKITSNNIEGDIGIVNPGVRTIRWNLNENINVFSDKDTISLYAQVVPNVETGKALGLSLLYPGAGNKNLNPQKKYWWIGAIGYGLVASSIFMHSSAGNEYEKIHQALTPDEADELYNSALQKRSLGYGLAAGAGLVWTVDLVSVLSAAKKKKGMRIHHRDIPVKHIPVLSWQLDIKKLQVLIALNSKKTDTISFTDNIPPDITIVSPDIERGFKHVSDKRQLIVSGLVKDSSGISELLINGEKTDFGKNGFFKQIVLLVPGENTIIVKATDTYQNHSEQNFAVVWEATDPASEINWLSPVDERTITTSDQISIEACINSDKHLKEVTVYHNLKPVTVNIEESPEFRSTCDYRINEDINLSFGTNKITIIVEDGKNTIRSDRIIQYEISEKNYHALLIAVEAYNDPGINDLSNPIKDARHLYSTLTDLYTFKKENITLLENPDYNEIIGTLHRMRSKVGPEDNLLIFYAGHGYWDEDMKTGYWLPRDAEQDNPAQWLANPILSSYLGGIKSKHTLLIADACFSGGIFKTRDAFSNKAVVEKLYQLTSRKAMTSGTLKQVPDKSVFIEYMLKRLKENKDEYLTAEQLFSSLRTAVINNSPNIPQYGTIQNVGDEGGDFIFMKRK